MTALLLASDFDGTVAPIRTTPGEVAMDPVAAELFQRAQRCASVALALLSGRDLDDLRQHVGGVRAWLGGSHGLEVLSPGGDRLQAREPWEGSVPDEWASAAMVAGLRIEQKRFGVAVHWRGVAGIDATHPLILRFSDWATAEGLDLIPGRMVAEARVAGGRKVDVLKFLAARTEAARVLYAGDDLTDIPAIRWAAGRGRGFFVRSAEREEVPGAGVETVDSITELVEAFAGELEKIEGC